MQANAQNYCPPTLVFATKNFAATKDFVENHFCLTLPSIKRHSIPWQAIRSGHLVFAISVYIRMYVAVIPHICHFFYTHTFFVQKILHLKVREFTTKKASRQNNVNLRRKLLTTK